MAMIGKFSRQNFTERRFSRLFLGAYLLSSRRPIKKKSSDIRIRKNGYTRNRRIENEAGGHNKNNQEIIVTAGCRRRPFFHSALNDTNTSAMGNVSPSPCPLYPEKSEAATQINGSHRRRGSVHGTKLGSEVERCTPDPDLHAVRGGRDLG